MGINAGHEEDRMLRCHRPAWFFVAEVGPLTIIALEVPQRAVELFENACALAFQPRNVERVHGYLDEGIGFTATRFVDGEEDLGSRHGHELHVEAVRPWL